VVTNPDWLRKPNADEMGQYYPPRAMDLGKEGQASIKCSVTAKGTVENCMVVSETPDGLGFGAAAMRLSKLFKMKPQTRDGQSVDGAEVTIPIAFKLAG
jgi:protein TonB